MQLQANNNSNIVDSEMLEYKKSVRKQRFKARYLTVSFFGSVMWKIVRAVIITGLCFIILYPFLIKIINAFKGAGDFNDPTVRFIPKTFTLLNITTVLEEMKYGEALKNTAFISLGSSILQTLVCASVGYGFARFKFKLNGPLFAISIFTLIVPPQTIIIPIFLRFRFFLGISSFNLIDTAAPMLIMALTCMGLKNGLFVFLFRQLFKNMPKELEEAAYLDGCGSFKTFTSVMLPGAGSMLLTVFLLSFSWQWTDTIYSDLFFSDMPILSNMVSLVGANASNAVSANYMSVASLLAIIPVAIIYAFAQKFFIESIDRTGIVG